MSDDEQRTNNKHYYMYLIRCSDGGCVLMDEERLEFLLDLMPTLRFLLLGHPRMKPKELQELEDGTAVLDIPAELVVSQEAFLLLVGCVLEARPLPPRCNKEGTSTTSNSNMLAMLENAMMTLGGCEVLEERLKDHHANPLTPEEDTNDDYEWQVLHMSKLADIGTDLMEKLATAGYTYVTSTLNVSMATHLYRKKK